MADPISAGLMIVGAVTSIAGGMGAAAGAQAQGEAALRAGNYNAQIAENEALQADRNRQIALQRATLDARDQSVKNRAMQGQIRAAYGASGFGVEGAPLDVLQSTAVESQLDIDKILYKGDVEGANYTDQANSFRQKAALYRMGGASAAAAGQIGASTAMLSGLTGVAKIGASSGFKSSFSWGGLGDAFKGPISGSNASTTISNGIV